MAGPASVPLPLRPVALVMACPPSPAPRTSCCSAAVLGGAAAWVEWGRGGGTGAAHGGRCCALAIRNFW